MKRCSHCGYLSPNPEARFCGKCGSKFIEKNRILQRIGRAISILGMLVGILFLIGIGINIVNGPGPPDSASSPAPVAYLKEVRIQREGEDGLAVYFQAVDADNNDTTANGMLTLNIFAFKYEPESAEQVYSHRFPVSADDFSEYTMRNVFGALPDALLWRSPRIPYSDIKRPLLGEMPEDESLFHLVLPNAYAEIVLTTSDGRTFKGKSDTAQPYTFEE
jgi:hypothetical protein